MSTDGCPTYRGSWSSPCAMRGLRRGVVRVPVAGDIDATGHLNAVVSGDIIEESLQRRRPARAPGQPKMQAQTRAAETMLCRYNYEWLQGCGYVRLLRKNPCARSI
jgi:hypothetical protein